MPNRPVLHVYDVQATRYRVPDGVVPESGRASDSGEPLSSRAVSPVFAQESQTRVQDLQDRLSLLQSRATALQSSNMGRTGFATTRSHHVQSSRWAANLNKTH